MANKNKTSTRNNTTENSGQRIARLRKEKGLTQKELAAKTGITYYQVSDYETGRVHLNDEIIIKFALALGASADDILGISRTSKKNSQPSLRLMKRLLKIQKMPVAQQKALLKTIDMALKASNL